MSRYPHASFLQSANQSAQFVADEGVEVAFAGRSNAGKSSAINAIVGRRQFARTSKTPGRTQLVNFFELMPGRRLVDLPGYGFARVSAATRQHWGRLMTAYFAERQSLSGLVIVVDARRGLTEGDFTMLELAESVELPILVLLSKSDKLKRGQARRGLAANSKRVSRSGRGTRFFGDQVRGRGRGAPRAGAVFGRVLNAPGCSVNTPGSLAQSAWGNRIASPLREVSGSV